MNHLDEVFANSATSYLHTCEYPVLNLHQGIAASHLHAQIDHQEHGDGHNDALHQQRKLIVFIEPTAERGAIIASITEMQATAIKLTIICVYVGEGARRVTVTLMVSRKVNRFSIPFLDYVHGSISCTALDRDTA